MKKERLDVLLVEKNLVSSRERAKSSIMAGLVFVDNKKIDKAGTLVPTTANIVVTGDNIGYVSRGGLKLAKAIKEFQIELKDKVVADIGASTGGFTDCSLQNGAKKVYAIDVGYGQLAWSLRTNDKVINMERTNIRNVQFEDIGEFIEFASIDVAFISLTKVLLPLKVLMAPKAEIVALIKPQFEAGKENVGKKGVVRDSNIHLKVITEIVNFCVKHELNPVALTYSPVKGPEGNIEYLLYLRNEEVVSVEIDAELIQSIVTKSHEQL